MPVMEDLNKLRKKLGLKPGQFIQGSIAIVGFLTYMIIIGSLLFTNTITEAWIYENSLGLTFLGIIFIGLIPIYRDHESILKKVLEEVGFKSGAFLLLTGIITIGKVSGLITPASGFENAMFWIAERAFYILWIPFVLAIVMGNKDDISFSALFD